MAVCAVVESWNRFHRDISAFSFTEFLQSHLTLYGEGEFELLAKRRVAFVAAISREDGSIVDNYQIRSGHFVYGVNLNCNTLDKEVLHITFDFLPCISDISLGNVSNAISRGDQYQRKSGSVLIAETGPNFHKPREKTRVK